MKIYEVDFNEIAYSYQPFKLLKIFKIVGVNNFLLQNAILAIGFCFSFIFAAAFDETFILKNENLGLIEHPSIWIFIALQVTIPFAQSKALKKIYHLPNWNDQIIDHQYLITNYSNILAIAKKDLKLESLKSKSIFRFLVFLGLAAFIWNSYQNQLPDKFLGFDFWDSINNPVGYWLSRLYKLYLWCLLIPFCINNQLMLTFNLLKLLRNASKEGKVDLNPFTKNMNGGFHRYVIEIVTPIVPVLFIAGIHSLIVALIHNNLHYTPIIGIFLFCSFLFLAYLLPVLSVRQIIICEKKRRIRKIGEEQNEVLKKIRLKEEFYRISELTNLLKSMSYLSEEYNRISNWPGLIYSFKRFSIAYGPTLITVIIKNIIPLLS
ncbi:hypothetical protein EMN47_16055 [Prolixibacteraceae bacterium JC049]|nr:hypothetical protein [Prolixibacteraceae bacterium JC049]